MHTAMVETGLTFSADAIAQAEVALVNNELIVTAAEILPARSRTAKRSSPRSNTSVMVAFVLKWYSAK